jgi:hypothetical protein
MLPFNLLTLTFPNIFARLVGRKVQTQATDYHPQRGHRNWQRLKNNNELLIKRKVGFDCNNLSGCKPKYTAANLALSGVSLLSLACGNNSLDLHSARVCFVQSGRN